MPDTQVINRREHDHKVDELTRTIDRLNGELSALAAYLITTKRTPTQGDAIRAAKLAARLGHVSKREAAQSIRRIHDAVVLSGHLA